MIHDKGGGRFSMNGLRKISITIAKTSFTGIEVNSILEKLSTHNFTKGNIKRKNIGKSVQ